MKLSNFSLLAVLNLIAFQVTAQSTEQPRQCIAADAPSSPCERLIIKKTDPRIMRQGVLSTPTICVCLSDFPSLISEQSDSTALSAEERQILSDWNLTKQQLNQLLRY
ncbi:hypothetical protein [Alteromonas oceanisediminis]|uniref:hypothetical protein n=1 Tax=Alteromonas oceanisediminis TaxID=2836180 RepID=UPI001BDAA4D1|nr:hypothetical protein [Alteromonas oceanisediminis]MBT0586894.1 hypothetical protein [Alteromonas oceanisediminis]